MKHFGENLLYEENNANECCKSSLQFIHLSFCFHVVYEIKIELIPHIAKNVNNPDGFDQGERRG